MPRDNFQPEIKSAHCETFAHYLRTGRRPDVAFKFNPYHDPQNGRFTFAPGGPRSLSNVVISDRNRRGANARPKLARDATEPRNPLLGNSGIRPEKPSRNDAKLLYPQPRGPRSGRGGNIRAFWDPMTLQEAFPGLAGRPAGAIISVADNLFDITGPAGALTASLTRRYSNALIAQIQAIDPNYRFDPLGFSSTLQGQINQINGLRMDRAAALYRGRGEIRPLQVETLRFLQRKVDEAYEVGLQRLQEGELEILLSPREALGNFIDRRVRQDLRGLYNQLGIRIGSGEPVRVIGRQYDISGSDRTYRIPDARVGDVAFDVTLTRKTLATDQIRGFFNTDFRPASVVIVRPRQDGRDSTYIIKRPRN